MRSVADLLSLNAVLCFTASITMLVWLAQELIGRRYRIQALCKRLATKAQNYEEAPVWLRILSAVLGFSWIFLAATIFIKQGGDFALILVAFVLLAGTISALDKLFFRNRRVKLMGAAPVQQVLSKIRIENDKQELINWAEADFSVAEYAKSFFPVLLVVLVLRSFLLEPFKIPSASMVPTLQVHDFILVNKFAYGLRLPVWGKKIIPVGMPKRGDVMVFYPPNDTRYFIKRVIGLPGDHIQLKDNVLHINGVMMTQEMLYTDNSSIPTQLVIKEDLQPHEHLLQHVSIVTPQSNYETVVPAGSYFMMGDNRDNSSDSRFWGMVPESNVVGRAVYVWMHWDSTLSLPSFSRNGAIQ